MTATEARPLSGVPSAASRVAAEISAEPDAGLLLDITGPGGCAKTPVLEAAARAYAEAGVPVVRSLDGGAGPADGAAVLIDDAHQLDEGQLTTLRQLAGTPGQRLLGAHPRWAGRPAPA